MIDSFVTCRSCSSEGLVAILDLGCTPLANALLKSEELDRPEATFPLELVFCPSCSLVQISETVPPERLFSNYPYFSCSKYPGKWSFRIMRRQPCNAYCWCIIRIL